MKIATLFMSLMVIGSLAQAQEVVDNIQYVKYCAGPSIVVNVEVFESGIVGWVVTDMTTGQNEQFMGFISAGDSKDIQNEFYSTDLGSDLHVNGKNSTMILSNQGTRKIKLNCN